MRFVLLAAAFAATVLAHAEDAPLNVQQQKACFEGFRQRGWVTGPKDSWEKVSKTLVTGDDRLFVAGNIKRGCVPYDYIVNLSKGTVEPDWGDGTFSWAWGQVAFAGKSAEANYIAGKLKKVFDVCRKDPAKAEDVYAELYRIRRKYMADEHCWSSSTRRAEAVIHHQSDGDPSAIPLEQAVAVRPDAQRGRAAPANVVN